MKKIALEEAYVAPNVEIDAPQVASFPGLAAVMERLGELADMRLRAMDEGEVELSVVSPTSPIPQGVADAGMQTEIAMRWNDFVANAIEPNKKRLRAFAALPTRDPDACIRELTRAVKDLGMVGALVNGYDDAGGNEEIYFDAPQYLDFWKTAAELDVPIYLHPRVAPPKRMTTYRPYPQLNGAAWGFHVETAEHILRLIMSGLYDKVPDVKIAIGHMGEFLPFWCWRIDHRLNDPCQDWGFYIGSGEKPLKLPTITDYVKKLYITTSGYFNTAALVNAMATMPLDRIMYSVDYPYESYKNGNDWWETLDLDQETKEAIAYKNAEKLLKVKI